MAPLYVDLGTTPEIQDHIQEIATLLGTPLFLKDLRNLQPGVYKYAWVAEFEILRTAILNLVSKKTWCMLLINNGL